MQYATLRVGIWTVDLAWRSSFLCFVWFLDRWHPPRRSFFVEFLQDLLRAALLPNSSLVHFDPAGLLDRNHAFFGKSTSRSFMALPPATALVHLCESDSKFLDCCLRNAGTTFSRADVVSGHRRAVLPRAAVDH